jgi:hypothetical protein
MSAILGGVRISHITNVAFSGSSNPISLTFPRAIGALLKPSDEVDRRITIDCSWHIANKTKTEIEALHYNLGEEVAKHSRANLIVNDNTYQDVVPASVDFDVMTHNQYFRYSLDFILSDSQNFMQAQPSTTQVRDGYFQYKYQDKDQSFSEFRFRFYNNWEAAMPVSFSQLSRPRKFRTNAPVSNLNDGIVTIALSCWLAHTSVQHKEAYMFNYLCSCGPLGKIGTLFLNGNTYENVIMTGLNTGTSNGGKDSEGNGSGTLLYDLQFQMSLQC